MKIIEIKDKKTLTILNKKGVITKEIQGYLDRLKVIEDEGKELEAKFNTGLTRQQLIDEKARPLVKKITDKIELEEYEQVSKVSEVDGGWNIEIADRLEEFKKVFADSKKESKEESKEESKK